MKPSAQQSRPEIEQLFCPAPRVQEREILRKSPDISFLARFNYSEKKWSEAIRAEIGDRWIALNKGDSPNPITNERGYKKITKQVREKYAAIHREQRARTILWLLSERTLNLLRSKGLTSTPSQEILDQAMMRFLQRLNIENFPEIEESLPQLGPNEYFDLSRPQLVADYGYPFYSTIVQKVQPDGGYVEQESKPDQETITGINTDLWAAFLGGDRRLGHDLVFFSPESTYYFFDLVAQCYLPTTEAKVRLVLSQAIQSRAWAQSAGLGNTMLVDFRTKKVFDEIIAKSKAILAAEAGFFYGPDARPKWAGVPMPHEVQVVVDSFVKENVEQAEGGIMTLGDCLLQLGKTSAASVNKKDLTLKMNDAIRSTFNRGLRNDLRLPDNRTVSGWKGLRLRGIGTLQGEFSSVRASVKSGLSEQESEVQTKELALVS
jgi:hypothetical protein